MISLFLLLLLTYSDWLANWNPIESIFIAFAKLRIVQSQILPNSICMPNYCNTTTSILYSYHLRRVILLRKFSLSVLIINCLYSSCSSDNQTLQPFSLRISLTNTNQNSNNNDYNADSNEKCKPNPPSNLIVMRTKIGGFIWRLVNASSIGITASSIATLLLTYLIPINRHIDFQILSWFWNIWWITVRAINNY